MICNEWKESVLKDVIEFNPKETIKKGTLSKKVAMDKLDTFTRKISGYEETEFTSGTKFRNGDTLLARITPCLENGKTARVDILEDNEIGFGSTEFIVMREKEGKTINDFIYYLSISPEFRNIAIKSMTGSSGRQRVQKDVLENVEIKLPPLEEQEKIANILSCLDDKIELNNEMNKTLEEMAQSIFKRWFVDFEFPSDDGEPYKSSGGEMVDSELGMIPKGWKVKTIGDIAEVTDYVANGSFASLKNNVKQGEEEDYAVLIRLVDYNRNFKGPFMYVDENGYKFLKKSTLFGGEIIISNVGANAGTVFKAPKLNKPMTLGPNSIMILKNEMDNYLYYYFNGYIGKEKLQTIIGGSAQPKFNKTDFRNIKIIVPNKENINKFNQILKPITDKLEEINIENSNLEDIRDNLLPKLMNGEIKLSS